MGKIYGIMDEALHKGEPHPYYHNMFMRIQKGELEYEGKRIVVDRFFIFFYIIL